jgi:hypothetical protein
MPRVQDDAKAYLPDDGFFASNISFCQLAMIWYSSKHSWMPTTPDENNSTKKKIPRED